MKENENALDKKEITIIGYGELLYDMFYDKNDAFEGMRAGGAPINFVYHATQNGAKGYAISAICNDEFGKKISKELEDNSISGEYISIVDQPTGTVRVNKLEKGHTFKINRSRDSSNKGEDDAAWEYIPLTDASKELMKRADAICFGTLALQDTQSYKTLKELLKYAPEKTLRFFDINMREKFYSEKLIIELLELANVFKMNDDELAELRAMFHLEGTDNEICRWFMDTYNLKYVILTAGAVCSTIYSRKEISAIWTPADIVKEIADRAVAEGKPAPDSVGAGDSFSGTFVYSILAGDSLSEAHKKAVDVSAFVCTQVGAWPSYSNYSWKFGK